MVEIASVFYKDLVEQVTVVPMNSCWEMNEVGCVDPWMGYEQASIIIPVGSNYTTCGKLNVCINVAEKAILKTTCRFNAPLE